MITRRNEATLTVANLSFRGKAKNNDGATKTWTVFGTQKAQDSGITRSVLQKYKCDQ